MPAKFEASALFEFLGRVDRELAARSIIFGIRARSASARGYPPPATLRSGDSHRSLSGDRGRRTTPAVRSGAAGSRCAPFWRRRSKQASPSPRQACLVVLNGRVLVRPRASRRRHRAVSKPVTALACRPDRGLGGDQPRPRIPLEVRLMPRQVHHLVERHPGIGAVRARNPQAERRVGYVVAARFADPELPVRHVCAARLVAGEQAVDVEAPLSRRLDHHLRKDPERLAEEEVARHPFAATGAELIELVEAGEERGEDEELAHLPADLEQAPRRLDVEGGRGDQVENGPEDGGSIGGIAVGPAQRPVQRRTAGVVARLEARAAPEQGLDQRHVAGEGGEHQRREALRSGVVDAVLLGPREHLLEVLPLEALESAPGDPRALRLVLCRGLEPASPARRSATSLSSWKQASSKSCCLALFDTLAGASALSASARRLASWNTVQGTGRSFSTCSRMASACSCLPCVSSRCASRCHSSADDFSACTEAALSGRPTPSSSSSGCLTSSSTRITCPTARVSAT